MFGFTEDDGYAPHEVEDLGSEGRFPEREQKFVRQDRRFPRLQHRLWWLAHNCVAHMAIGLFPHPKTFWLHDWTSRKLNAE